MYLLFLMCVSLLIVFSSTRPDEKCILSSKYGILQGKYMNSRSGRVFSAFLGIPYAKPPVGNLRFLPPQPPVIWEGIRNSTKENNICLQGEANGSEDCLYLNVFTHNKNSSAVMVYIHGGGFYMGSSSMDYLGPDYLMDRDIVLVTLQYRLGVFGFLSTEDDVIPGNMGLKDQVKALQWVQENIITFGGDPKKVTLFGNSAGGASVHFHMFSPLSTHLFLRGISQSGTAFSSFALIGKGKSRKHAEKFSLTVNCTVQNSIEILNCLQNKSALEILDAFNKQRKSRYGVSKIFRPVIEEENENAFITKKFWGQKTDKTWIVGVNANEGLLMIKMAQINQTIQLIQSEFNLLGPHLMFIHDLYSNLEQISNLTYDFYFKNNSSRDYIIKSLENMVSDSWIVWPTKKAIDNHNGSVYYYLYGHQSEHTYKELFDTPRVEGVSHCDELLVLFAHRKFFPELNDQDTNVSKVMVNMWANFAAEGNPTPNLIRSNPQCNDSEYFTWKVADSSDPEYLHIQTYNLSMNKNMFPARMEFWQHLQLNYLK